MFSFSFFSGLYSECFDAHGSPHPDLRLRDSGTVGARHASPGLGLRRDEWGAVRLPAWSHLFRRIPDHLRLGKGRAATQASRR